MVENLFNVRDVIYSSVDSTGEKTEGMTMFEEKVSGMDDKTNLSGPDLSNSELPEDLASKISQSIAEQKMADNAFITEAKDVSSNSIMDDLRMLSEKESKLQQENKGSLVDKVFENVSEVVPETKVEVEISEKVEPVVEPVKAEPVVEPTRVEPVVETANVGSVIDSEEVPQGSILSGAQFLADLGSQIDSLQQAPIVINSIADTEGRIRAKVENFCVAYNVNCVPLDAIYTPDIADAIKSIDGFTIYRIFDRPMALKKRIREDVVNDYINKIKNSLEHGKEFVLNLRVNMKLIEGSMVETLLLSLEEIAYIIKVFSRYNARIDADESMKDRVILQVG